MPLAADFQQEQIAGKVDSVPPTLFKHTDHRNGLLNRKHVDSRLEVVTSSHCINIVIELFNRTMLQRTIKNAEQYGIIGKQLAGILVSPSATLFTNFMAASCTASYSLIEFLMTVYVL